jgi:hypothetical protein
VILRKFACPDAWDFPDPYGASLQELEGLCTQVLTGVPFDYEQNGAVLNTLQTGQDGSAFWDQAPPGQTVLREGLPLGYAFAVVHCSYHPAEQGNFAGAAQPVQMQDASSFVWNLEPGFVLDCSWFNFPADQIQLYKYWCPAELLPDDLSLPDYVSACGEQPGTEASWLIAQSGTGQEIVRLQPSADQPGYAGYHQLPQDQDVTILEQLPLDSGYGAPVVFCNEYARGFSDQPTGSYSYDPTAGVTWTPREGYYLVCVFFNRAVGEAGQIVVAKYWCPPALSFAQTPTLADLQTACQDSGSGATFELNGPEDSPQMWEVKSPGGESAASVSWEQLPEGAYLITETSLGEGWTSTVYCQESGGGQDGGEPELQPLTEEGSVQWTLQAGYVLVCAWFNQPVEETEGNSVTVYKWDCQPETEYGREHEYYQGALPDQEIGPCETQHTGVPLTLIDGSGERPDTSQADGTEWDDVSLQGDGTFQIQEAIPDGYGNPMVFCGTLDDETQQMVPATGGLVTLTPAAEPFTIQCNWYNLLAEENSVTVYKWDCQPGTEYGREHDYYQGALPDQETGPCETQHTGVPLTLIDGNGERPDTSQADGTEWDDVVLDQNGSFQIQEEIPDGYGDPMVFCGTLDDETQQMVPAEGGLVSLTPATEPFTYQCNWYNLPEDDEYNYVDFYKYVCYEPAPEGSDKTWYEENCDPVEGWNFHLQWTGGEAGQTTDASGYASWSGLPVGTWQATETLPEGYGQPVVWCRYVEWPDEAGVTGDWAQFDAPDGSYENGFGWEGMRIECHWYNFPPEDYNYVDFYKYLCTEQAPEGSDKSWYEDNCDPVENWQFDLQWTDGGSTDTTDASGLASWSGVPVGDWQGSETLPEGYGQPVVWCRYVEWPEEATATDAWVQFEAPDGLLQHGVEVEGMRIECHWYNFGAPPEIAEEPGDNWITIYKYLCPPGTVPSEELGVMQEACTDSHSGVEFSVLGEGGGVPDVKTTVGGVVEWTDLQFGGHTITETLPPGYGAPLVWCGYTVQDGVEIGEANQQYDPYTVTDGAIQAQLVNEPVRLVCYWFNFPGEETTVTVYKYDCDFKPAGYTTLGEWQDACSTWGDGRVFTLTDSEDNASDMTITNGSATWTGVPEGDFTLEEEDLPGWGEPIVWCGWTAYVDGAVVDAFPQQVTTTGGIYTGTITYPGTTYFCFWFNIPAEYSSITIYKFICAEGRLEGVVPNPLTAYLDLCETPGNGIEFTLETSEGESSATTLDGYVTWSDVPVGPLTITETVPPGYGPPIWFCREVGELEAVTTEGVTAMVPEGDALSIAVEQEGTRLICWVFNFPDPDRTVEVHKWYCPFGYAGESYEDWSANCTTPMHGVKFNLTDENGTWTRYTDGGEAFWYGVEPGEVTLDERIPPGYFEPVVYCSLEAENGAALAEGWTEYSPVNGAITRELDYSEFHWVCHFFNIPKGPGEITIYKWLCPPGYDFYGWGADPGKDCTQRWDGITFTVDQPVGPNLVSTTGDSIPGAVYFGDLDPGAYVVTETVPADIDYVFVLDCKGSDDDKVHPYPLQWGNTLTIEVAGGDSIVCNWYNVPKPETGWLTVYKYQCWTTTFVNTVDCEIYEFGASFELFGVPGNASQGVGTTNEGGLYTWYDLEEGAYDLDEISHQPCKITSTKVDGLGNAWVDVGQGTIVKVYNCKPGTPGTPGTPGKVPGKYPNTGVGPGAGAAAASLQDDPEETPIGTPTAPANATPEAEYFRISCLDVEGTPVASPEAEDSEPAPTATPTGEVEEFDLPIDEEPATPESEGSPAVEEECVRGALPERVVIDAARVDAGVETLEIVDGIMEQPTGPELVTWYKETGRLGEDNNVVIAGHLNYWNVPQGVFFYLDQLREGDVVEVTGDDGRIYVFEVEWVRQESNLEPPDAEVIGPTDEPSLTLITCGGEWDPSISEYDERTVARAVQVEIREPESA